MIYINLLPVRANQKKDKLIEQSIVLVVAVVLVLVACVGVYVVLLSKVMIESNDISKKEKQIAELKSQIEEVKNFENLQKDLRIKLDILDKLKLGRSGPVHLLDELANAVPRTVWLDSFKESSDVLTVTGQALSEDGIAAFLQNLEASSYIQNVELKGIDQTTKSNMKVKKFEITCKKQVATQVNTNNKKPGLP